MPKSSSWSISSTPWLPTFLFPIIEPYTVTHPFPMIEPWVWWLKYTPSEVAECRDGRWLKDGSSTFIVGVVSFFRARRHLLSHESINGSQNCCFEHSTSTQLDKWENLACFEICVEPGCDSMDDVMKECRPFLFCAEDVTRAHSPAPSEQKPRLPRLWSG